ncbi:MAG: hypothetical protein IJ905_02185 [Fibrobacter sp.]|nr:hypothetical protein [Fibrobacter sp.]
MKNILLLLFAFASLFISCSNSNEDSVADGKNVYRASCYLLELPEGYSVDDAPSESNSEWNVRYIKDSFDNRIMSFYDGEYTKHGKRTSKKCKKNGFMTYSRLDSMSIFHGAISVHRTVVIYANRSGSLIRRQIPLFVEFNYRPDLVDSAVCEKIIRSAKVLKK